jgi:hypothetical protein
MVEAKFNFFEIQNESDVEEHHGTDTTQFLAKFQNPSMPLR